MKNGLIDKIKSHTHWRCNIRPMTPLRSELSLGDCQQLVENARVSMRGWDFPHIEHGTTDHGGLSRTETYFENWTDWYTQTEFWRMYKSGQFLAYKLAIEESEPEYKKQGPILETVDAIYTIAEFVEFCYRLTGNEVHSAGVHLNVQLNNTSGRQLWAGKGRVPFFVRKQTDAQSISVSGEIMQKPDKSEPNDASIDMLLRFFDHFGWYPDRSQIRAELDNFYSRRF